MSAIQVRPFLIVATCVFALVTLGHVWRATTGAELRINSWDVPLALSWVASAVTGMLSVWGARLASAVGR